MTRSKSEARMSRKNRRTLGLVALLHVGACAFALVATFSSGSLIKRNQVLLSKADFEVAKAANRSVDIRQVAAYPRARSQSQISQPRDPSSAELQLQEQSFAQIASFAEARRDRDSRDGGDDSVGHVR